MFREVLAIIRQSNPRRTVIVGPTYWNSIDDLPKLNLLEDDRNLIVTIPFALDCDCRLGVNVATQDVRLVGNQDFLIEPGVVTDRATGIHYQHCTATGSAIGSSGSRSGRKAAYQASASLQY